MAGAKILIVDDEAWIRLAVERELKSKGYVVASAADGEEALEAFKTFGPRVIVMDVMMPKENGYRVSRAIKMMKDGSGSGLIPKILLLTARRTDDDPVREETLQHFSMADAILYKPVKPAELAEQIGVLLQEPADHLVSK